MQWERGSLPVIRVQGPAGGGATYGEIRTLTLDVKPCTRYYLKAVKKNALEQDFEPRVDYVEPIAGDGPAANMNPVGTGPFKFASYQAGATIELDANLE